MRGPGMVHGCSIEDRTEADEVGEYSGEARCENEEGEDEGSSAMLFVELPTKANRGVIEEKGHDDDDDDMDEDVGEDHMTQAESDQRQVNPPDTGGPQVSRHVLHLPHPTVDYSANARDHPTSSSPPLSSPNEGLEHWLVSEAHARDIPLPIAEVATWVRHAKEATAQRALQTLQTWLRLARQQQETSSAYRCELPELLSARMSPVLGDRTRLGDLAFAKKTVKDYNRAMIIGGQAVLYRRISYAKLCHLNQRAREQSVQT